MWAESGRLAGVAKDPNQTVRWGAGRRAQCIAPIIAHHILQSFRRPASVGKIDGKEPCPAGLKCAAIIRRRSELSASTERRNALHPARRRLPLLAPCAQQAETRVRSVLCSDSSRSENTFESFAEFTASHRVEGSNPTSHHIAQHAPATVDSATPDRDWVCRWHTRAVRRRSPNPCQVLPCRSEVQLLPERLPCDTCAGLRAVDHS